MTISQDPARPTTREELLQRCDYDTQLPLDPQERNLGEREGLIWHHVTFSSVQGRRVPGLLVMSQGVTARRPAVLVQHGSGSSKGGTFALAAIDILAPNGFVCLAIDAIGHGERAAPPETGQPPNFSPEVRAANVIDLRRALDYLQTRPEVDPSRLGYIGSSMGGMLGAILGGVDPRVRAVVLRCTGSRLLGGSEPQRWTDAAAFVPLIAPRPLLLLNNEQDEAFPPASARALFDAAKAPKEQRWFPGGHRDNPEVHAAEAWLFLRQHLVEAR